MRSTFRREHNFVNNQTVKQQPDTRPTPPVPRPIKRNKYWGLQWRLFWRAVTHGKITVRKLWNVALCHATYLLKIRQAAPAPYILSLEPWNECNAGCLFCRDPKGRIHDINPVGGGIIKGKMPAETAIDIIDQLKKDILIAVLYTNGEPMIYKELPEVIQAATDRKVSTLIASNGLMFTEENIRAILKAGIDVIKIQVSGFTQDIYSVQIRYGYIDDWKRNVTLLADINRKEGYNAVIMIDYILYNYNRHQLEQMRTFCDTLGLMMNTRPGNPFGGLEELEPKLVQEQLPLKMSCDYLWKVMQVNFNGDILPCCEAVVWSGSRPYETYARGKTDVKKVWRSEPALQMRHTMATKGRAAYDICSQCTRKGVCFKW